LGLRML